MLGLQRLRPGCMRWSRRRSALLAKGGAGPESGRFEASGLVGGHDPELADGGVPGPGDHVGHAVGDVLGDEDLRLLIEGVDHFAADLGRVVGTQLRGDATGFQDADAYVPPGDFLAEGFSEAVDAEFGEVVDTVSVPGDAPGNGADVDDVC